MFGTGLLKGLGVTLKHAMDTFEDDRESVPDRYKGSIELGNNRRVIQQPIDQEGLVTIQYPEEKRLLPERFRYIPMLIWDSETSEDRCTACGICAKVCPPQCIWIVRDSDENGKPVTRCSEFYIDAAVCMSCSFCVEFCPFDAIKMNHDYELAVYDRYPQLVYDMEELTVPLEYYAALWPTQFEEEETRRREEEEQKRRQEEEKAARLAAKKAQDAEKPAAAGAPKRSAAELQQLARQRAGQRQAQAADGNNSDDGAAAKKARMEELKRKAQEQARQRKQESGE
jgi:NADH-quinone oxidoreductase subunit I